jgi:hypothetical protein
MYKQNMFGVRFPETDQLGFVSVMGNLGEHLALALYLGKKGFEGFWTMQQAGYELTPDIVLQVPQLQASLEDRELITTEDRKIIKQLNLKFRGKNAWPQFRSYRPGCFPWYLEKQEAQMLITGLEQLLEIAPRFKNNPELIAPEGPDGEYLVRVHESGQWVDRYERIRFPADPPIQLMMNPDALDYIKTLPRQDAILEVDLHMTEQAVQDGKFNRPYFPFLFMVADKKSGMILGAELLSPIPSLEELWGEVPAVLVEILAANFRPKELQTKVQLIAMILSTFEKELGVKVRLVSRLPQIELAQREFRRFTGR